jgi:hypothetical protein
VATERGTSTCASRESPRSGFRLGLAKIHSLLIIGAFSSLDYTSMRNNQHSSAGCAGRGDRALHRIPRQRRTPGLIHHDREIYRPHYRSRPIDPILIFATSCPLLDRATPSLVLPAINATKGGPSAEQVSRAPAPSRFSVSSFTSQIHNRS